MINSAHVLGRIGKIDTRKIGNDNQVTNMSIVTSKKFTKNGEKQEKVTWHNITIFSKLSQIAERYCSVGDLVYIQGEMETQTYTAQDGQSKTKHYILAQELKMIPSGNKAGNKAIPSKAQSTPSAIPPDFSAEFADSEIPF